MTTHWTEQGIEDFAFRIAADFIAQLEDMMEVVPMSKKELANKLRVTKGRISQMFNNPGNLSLETIVEYSRALNMKVALVAYDDNDPGNDNGPINSDIFRICWEKAGKPRDFWAFQQGQDQIIQQYTTVPTFMAVKRAVPKTDMWMEKVGIIKPKVIQDSVQTSHLPIAKNA